MKHFLNFETFLNESVNHSSGSDKYVKELNRILLLNKQRGAEKWQILEIPTNWTVYTKFTKVPKNVMKQPSECYQNSLDFSKETGAKMIVGVFINLDNLKTDIKWMDEKNLSDDKEAAHKFNPFFTIYPHAFNLDKDGDVFDVTIYNDPSEYVYVGTEVDPSKFKDGFGDVMPYLNKMLKLDKS